MRAGLRWMARRAAGLRGRFDAAGALCLGWAAHRAALMGGLWRYFVSPQHGNRFSDDGRSNHLNR